MSGGSGSCDVVIIGGGLSGLSAALNLVRLHGGKCSDGGGGGGGDGGDGVADKLSLKITLLEARGRIGGRCLSVEGIDLVSSRFFSSSSFSFPLYAIHHTHIHICNIIQSFFLS